MQLRDTQRRRAPLSVPVSRRTLLTTAAVLSASATAPLLARDDGSILAYVGDYTPNGQGIYLFGFPRRKET
jgi:hypothetical protein